MKSCVFLLLAFVCVHGAPAGVLPPSSCKDPATIGVAGQALEKINLDRDNGYIFSLERVSDVHQTRHGETGVVYYLKIDVLETTCHVFSKKNWKECETRGMGEHPVYGQCKAAVYVNKPQRVLRLYKYSCNMRPVAASKIVSMCPDCPLMATVDNKEMVQTMKMGLEKFNNESTLPHYFAPLEITRATMQGGIATFYNVEFTIQETVCTKATDVADVSKCGIMTCEFAHKGFCKASRSQSWDNQEHLRVNCEIYEPQAAEEEKQKHSLAGTLDHHHENIGGSDHAHDHSQDHTVPHSHADAHNHGHSSDHKHDHKHDDPKKPPGHHHSHEHGKGKGKSVGHGHAHPHEHYHDHDHVHEHHNQAHNHTQHQGIHPPHHNYSHAEGETHEHDHELALDHEHKHGHLHEYEHHHHHHHRDDETETRHPEGSVHVHPSLDKPSTLPFFPDAFEKPDTPTTLPLRPDPQIPGEREPVIGRFPATISPNCPGEFKTNLQIIIESFTQDPLFNTKKPASKPS